MKLKKIKQKMKKNVFKEKKNKKACEGNIISIEEGKAQTSVVISGFVHLLSLPHSVIVD